MGLKCLCLLRQAYRYFFFFYLSAVSRHFLVLGLVGDCVGIHNTHVVNNFCPLILKVSYKDTPLQLSRFFWRCSFDVSLGLPSTHGPTYETFRVVTHVRGGKA